MSYSTLKRLTEKSVSEMLVGRGFISEGKLLWTKCLGDITQGVKLFKHSSVFSADVFLRYNNFPSLKANAMDYFRRAEWHNFKTKEEAIETASIVSIFFKETVLPFFDRYSDISTIISDLKDNKIDEKEFFGRDPGWRSFNLGWALMKAGELDAAARRFRQVVEDEASPQVDWVKDRKKKAAELLELAERGETPSD